jgi:hypothetical protein
MVKRKNPHAMALGALGGAAKTDKPKGLAALPRKRRMEIVRLGIAARRAKAKKEKF